MRQAIGVVSLVVLLMFLFAGNVQPAYAVAVMKVTTDIKVGLIENVPLASDEVWEIEATVGIHSSSESVTKVELRDVFIPEVTVDAVLVSECGPVTVEPGRLAGTTDVRWQIGTMAPGQSCALRLQVSTADGPPHQFQSSGEYCLNRGASVRFLNALSEQEARTGPSVCVTTL